MACDALCMIGESGGGLSPRDHPAHSSPGERKTGREKKMKGKENPQTKKKKKKRERERESGCWDI